MRRGKVLIFFFSSFTANHLTFLKDTGLLAGTLKIYAQF